MKETGRIVIPIKKGREFTSLCWQGDELVDWVNGGIRYRLDGSVVESHVNYGYRFDKAIACADGRYSVVYEQLGTKGVVLRGGEFVREINRSFYEADVYEYPIALCRLPDGRDVIIHCPKEYCKIEIEEIESGRLLTPREGKTHDCFHSRLQVSADSRFLVSAGWEWHPFDTVELFDLGRALAEPTTLDQASGVDLGQYVQIHAAAFIDADSLILAGGDDSAPVLGVYSLSQKELISKASLEEVAGTLMPVGELVVGFYEHPKLIDTRTGQIVHRWPEINSGCQNSSIVWHIDKVPPFALDPANQRFAVADAESIVVIQLG